MVSLEVDRDLLRRPIVALESGRAIDVDVLLQQELAPVSLSIATLDRSHLPINTNETWSIMYGMAAIQSMGNRGETKMFGEWCNNFLMYVLRWFRQNALGLTSCLIVTKKTLSKKVCIWLNCCFKSNISYTLLTHLEFQSS